MNPWVSMRQTESGVALPLALFALVMLSGFLAILLSMGGMEPTMAANLHDVTQARYMAEAGLEWGFDQLVVTFTQPNGWNTLLSTKGGQMATNMTVPGLTGTSGTFSVTVRNDTLPNDPQITGQPVDPGGPATDTNRVVILTATGTYNRATRQIQQVVTNLRLNTPGALNLPGVGSNTVFSGNAFTITGDDTNVDDTRGTGTPGVCPASAWGIGVSSTALESVVEASLNNSQKNNVTGQSQYPGPAYGNNTIAPETSLTPLQIAKFVNAIRPYADISLEASGSNHLQYQNLGDTCAISQNNDRNCWGTRSNPKIVYVKGTVDPAQAYYALEIAGTSTGAGILIVEDGDLSITGNFRWEGIILITGQYAGLFYGGGGYQTIYGSVIVNETASLNSEVEVNSSGNAKVLYSCEALNNAQNLRKLFKSTSWREL